jgi:hypothetical protein
MENHQRAGAADMNTETQVRQIMNVLGEGKVMDTLKRLKEMEESKSLLKINKIRGELAAYESRYGMSSDTAWERFNHGELGDDMDVMEWMALYENLIDFKKEYDRISKCEFA